MADTSFNSVAPALMVLALFLIIISRNSWWSGLSITIRAVVSIVVAALTVVPFFFGVSTAGLLLSLSPVFSIGSTVLLSLFVIKAVTVNSAVTESRAMAGKGTTAALLDRRDLLLFCLWNSFLGIGLYSSTLGLLPYDLYFLGYTFSWVFLLTALITLLVIFIGSRLAWIFLFYVIAWNHTLLPSPNFFDYIIDPVLFCISIVTLFMYGLRYMRGCKAES